MVYLSFIIITAAFYHGFLMSIYLSANTPSVLDCSHSRDSVRDSWMSFPFWRFKSAKKKKFIIVDVLIYGCHLPTWH
jgi:hypothetical protein